MKSSMKFVISGCLVSMYCAATPFTFTSHKGKWGGWLQETFLQQLVDAFHPDVFFETGTYDGNNANVAASFFKQVHTVELSAKMYEKAQQRLSGKPQVNLYFGSSPEYIALIGPKLDGHILFWLDAHYSGGDTAMSHDDTNDPDAITAIRNELRAIAAAGITDCTILIDDIRGFGSIVDDVAYLGCWAYPCVQEVHELARNINPNFACVLLGDILLLYDSTRFTPTFSPVVKACTATRLYDGKNLTDEALLAAERDIMGAQGQERDFIIDLYKHMTDYQDPLFHHDLWYALVCMGAGDWHEARIALAKVPYRNKSMLQYTHWRINAYMQVVLNHI